MKIHLYSLAWNEEKLIPHFMKYYARFCEKIVVYDNESTDRTPAIVRSFPQGEVRTWSSGNQNDEQLKLDIKNTAYKESRGKADWVIVCDADEFLYHPRLVAKLGQYRFWGINFPKVEGFQMVPDDVVGEDIDDLPARYRQGVPYANLDKRIVFDPVLDVEYDAGAHHAKPSPGARESLGRSLKLLHYKMLNLDYYVERNRTLGGRLSELSKQKGWGVHYVRSREQMEQNYRDYCQRRRTVI